MNSPLVYDPKDPTTYHLSPLIDEHGTTQAQMGAQMATSMLPEPPKFTPQSYAGVSPTRALWAHTLSNIGNYIAQGGGEYKNTALDAFQQAQVLQQRHNLQQQQLERQAWQDQMTHAQAGPKMEAQQMQIAGHQELIDAGINPYGPASLQEFQMMGGLERFPGGMTEFAEWKAALAARSAAAKRGPTALQQNTAWYMGLSDEERAAADFLLRDQGSKIGDVEITNTSRGPMVADADGNMVPATLENLTAAAKRQGTYKGASKSEADHYADATQFQIDFERQMPALQANLESNIKTLEELTAGAYDETGLLARPLMRHKRNADLAKLNALAVKNMLDGLQITSLTPVTEKEIEIISGLWGSIENNPEANEALIRLAIQRTRGLMARMRAQNDYINNRGDLRGFDAWYRQQMGGPATESNTDGAFGPGEGGGGGGVDPNADVSGLEGVRG